MDVVASLYERNSLVKYIKEAAKNNICSFNCRRWDKKPRRYKRSIE